MACSFGHAFEFHVEADLGDDVGQSFGSLFEVTSTDGSVVFGAGFLDVYNTYYRSDRHVIHFFARPTSGETRSWKSEILPRPGDLAGTYIFSDGEKLYAANPEARVWEPAEGIWKTDDRKERNRTRLGDGMLLFDSNSVTFGGEKLLEPPEVGFYSRFYYALGHVFFYHTFRGGNTEYRLYTDDESGFTRIYACPWTPKKRGTIDLGKARVMTVPVVGENPFAYGQLENEVLTCSNIGGIYVFDGTAWRTILDGELKTSYQVYTMIPFYDRLLLGQYPTGELFEYDGETVRHLAGWPPKMPGVSGSSREAQTATIYGGDLFVGVWPWGEVWRYRPDPGQWDFVRRMFTHPELTNQTTHPYERECAALGGVANLWGQRVTGLTVLGADLMVSTSAKSPCEWKPEVAFLENGLWKEYGSIHKLTIPGHASAPIDWTGKPTAFSIRLSDGELSIVQDGQSLTTCTFPIGFDAKIRATDVKWGEGIYGAFGGAAMHGKVVSE
jgi:hypothetical protein